MSCDRSRLVGLCACLSCSTWLTVEMYIAYGTCRDSQSPSIHTHTHKDRLKDTERDTQKVCV